ncbi:hypothetical protein [Nibribacter koreensis]|uniref:Uncharacterized protein n=1 Tax=Nibribacter koreensis TaxID=1084519 RepID=A0ABP8FM90_9BACT
MFILLFLLLVLGVPSGFIYLAYWFPKKLGYIRLGRILSSTLFSVFALVIAYISLEDEFFTKGDANELLLEQNIVLHDNFALKDNESTSGIGDSYQKFILEISAKDKARIISEIKNSSNFRTLETPAANDVNFSLLTNSKYKSGVFSEDYETEYSYKRVFFKFIRKDYAPTYRVVSISKGLNELTFELY